jgi:hypothetical protein
MITFNYPLFLQVLVWAWGVTGLMYLVSAAWIVKEDSQRIACYIVGLIMLAMLFVCMVI